MASSLDLVIPGQPLTDSSNVPYLAGPGTFTRGGAIYASLKGHLTREGGVSQETTLL